jgi:hypothetical protein
MVRARAEGHGVRLGHWHLPNASSIHAPSHILDWCRNTLAGVRRPFGIDHFDLAVACGNGRGSVESRRFFKLKATDLYDDGIAHALSGLVARWAGEEELVFAAAIFSWGEAAHRALPERLPG